MKVILNVNTNFEGVSLSIGTELDVELRIAERWINRGLAHLPAIKDVEVKAVSTKTFDEYVKDTPVKAEITYEDLDDIGIFREPEVKEEVTEVDVIEPISIDHYVDFEEPKEVKPIKKAKKK